MKRMPGIAMLTIAGLAAAAACNYTDGQCYPRGEVPGGGAGGQGGVIVPGGPGGFGDVPPDPQDADDPPPDCDMPDETELSQVSCGRPNWGVECMILCGENGAPCRSQINHTITGKPVLLYKCCGCKGGQCWYVDPDDIGRVCVYSPETGPKWAKCQ